MNATKVWFDNERIFVLTDNNEIMSQSLKWYPRLMQATEEQRSNYALSSLGIHWVEIDEDVSFESFTYEEEEYRKIVK